MTHEIQHQENWKWEKNSLDALSQNETVADNAVDECDLAALQTKTHIKIVFWCSNNFQRYR